MTFSEGREYFHEIARHWSLLGPPLRPSEPDLAGYMRGVSRLTSPRAVILGVTPELFRLPWPDGTELLAIDHNAAMIEAVWPGPPASARQATWQALPLNPASQDVVLCDGGLSVLAFPDECSRVIAEVAKVLAPGGLALFRLYVPPEVDETADTVLADLWSGEIRSPNHLKLRLAMALQNSSREGVPLALVWETLHASAPDFRILAEQVGWRYEELCAIHAYRDSANRYYFPNQGEVASEFCEEGFTLEFVSVPEYGMGACCPVVCFKRLDLHQP